jgi:N-acetylmuramoyl-L-alanine amidase
MGESVMAVASTSGSAARKGGDAVGGVGKGDHVVRQGECISSIAGDSGHFWCTIWQDAANAELRRVRQNPNALLPGDRVHVPDIRTKQESGATETRHTFRRRGEPCTLRLRLLEDGQPREGLAYILEVDGEVTNGIVGAEGIVETRIPPGARQGKLTLLVGETKEVYPLDLGHIDPADTISGAQGRLHCLGYDVGRIDGKLGPSTEAALRDFQNNNELSVTGRLDGATAARLKEVFGG